MLTKEQAQLICDAHDIDAMLDTGEEVDLLRAENPQLLDAYTALLQIANGAVKLGEFV